MLGWLKEKDEDVKEKDVRVEYKVICKNPIHKLDWTFRTLDQARAAVAEDKETYNDHERRKVWSNRQIPEDQIDKVWDKMYAEDIHIYKVSTIVTYKEILPDQKSLF